MIVARKPLPQPNQPVATSQQQLTLPYALYLSWLDAQLNALLAASPNVQTASYTFEFIDGVGIVEMNIAGANTLTVPPNSAIPFSIGTHMKFVQAGAGQTTLTPGAGVTLRSRVGLKTAGQWAVAEIYKRATDEWVASGDLTP